MLRALKTLHRQNDTRRLNPVSMKRKWVVVHPEFSLHRIGVRTVANCLV